MAKIRKISEMFACFGNNSYFSDEVGRTRSAEETLCSKLVLILVQCEVEIVSKFVPIFETVSAKHWNYWFQVLEPPVPSICTNSAKHLHNL